MRAYRVSCGVFDLGGSEIEHIRARAAWEAAKPQYGPADPAFDSACVRAVWTVWDRV